MSTQHGLDLLILSGNILPYKLGCNYCEWMLLVGVFVVLHAFETLAKHQVHTERHGFNDSSFGIGAGNGGGSIFNYGNFPRARG